MAAHFVQRRRRRQILPPIDPVKPAYGDRTPINHLTRPHAAGFENSATAGEMAVLVLALAVLIALVSWLGWIVLRSCVNLLREKMDERSSNVQSKRPEERAESFPKLIGNMGWNASQGLRSAIFGCEKDGNRDKERAGRSEQSRLLTAFEGKSYGHGKQQYQRGDGDGTSDSSGRTKILHREDCEGQCGQARRRSGD